MLVMKPKLLLVLVTISLLLAACSSAAKPAATTPTANPAVVTDSSIVAEGRLEPVHAAQLELANSKKALND